MLRGYAVLGVVGAALGGDDAKRTSTSGVGCMSKLSRFFISTSACTCFSFLHVEHFISARSTILARESF